MGDLASTGYATEDWSGGQPRATWYDKYGRTFVLPADPYHLEHYQERGLSLRPPESPLPLVEDNDRSEGSAGATRGGPVLEVVPERKGRGPDRKPRKRRKKKRR